MEEFIKPQTTFGEIIRFTPYAYSKLIWMRDRGNTEVAGYCVTETKDPLLITDFCLIKQKCTAVTFDLDPNDIVDYMERMMDRGLPPWACVNILAHSHPGNSPNPSGVDEDNFKKAFSHPDWAIMLIIAQDDSMYCRLRLNVGPGVEKLLKVEVDFNQDFPASNHFEWDKEYKDKVSKETPIFRMTGKESNSEYDDIFGRQTWWDDENSKWVDFDKAQKAEIDKMAGEKDQDFDSVDIDCHWSSNGDVEYWSETEEDWYVYDPIQKKWYILDDNLNILDVDKPPTGAQAVVEWANEYAYERQLVLLEDE